jgi:Fanconi-associated nuclease 1
VDDRLLLIENEFERALEMIRESFVTNHKTLCVGINWEICELDELIIIAEGLGGEKLSKILAIMAKIPKRRSGLPDLLLFREKEGDQPPLFKLVEVKGPGDSLMSHQTVWIELMIGMGVDVSVCKVVATNPLETTAGERSRKRKEVE